MAATVNARDVLISGQARTVPVTLPSDINVSGTVTGNVTGTLNGTPVTTVVTNAANGANHASATGNPHGVTFSQIGDLDDISNGSTYFKTTSTQVTGAGRAYNALDANNEYIKTLTSTKLAVVGSNPSTGWVGDANGIRMYQGGSIRVNIPVSGTPSFSGDITGGANINITGNGSFNGATNDAGSVCALLVNSSRNQAGGIRVYSGSSGIGIYANSDTGSAGYGGFFRRQGAGSAGAALIAISSTAAPGMIAQNDSTGNALEVNGRMTITSTSTVGNLSADMVDGYHVASLCNRIGSHSGTATVSGSTFNIFTTVSGVTTTGSGSNINIISTSDERLKQDIAPEPLGLDFINDLRPVEYRLRARPEMKYHGFIAQDMRALITADDDCLYQENLDGTLGTDYVGLIAPAVKSIQQLAARQVAIEQFLNSQFNFQPMR
jgi:hypothetical protein